MAKAIPIFPRASPISRACWVARKTSSCSSTKSWTTGVKPWREQRAWEAISLDMAQTASRRAQNAATIDHALNAGIVLAGQVGTTEGQQTVSPAGTAASETTKGAVAAAGAGEAVSAEAVTANVANLFTSLTPVIASALAAAISQTIAALVPVVVTASGGASTPSQTQPKAA